MVERELIAEFRDIFAKNKSSDFSFGFSFVTEEENEISLVTGLKKKKSKSKKKKTINKDSEQLEEQTVDITPNERQSSTPMASLKSDENAVSKQTLDFVEISAFSNSKIIIDDSLNNLSNEEKPDFSFGFGFDSHRENHIEETTNDLLTTNDDTTDTLEDLISSTTSKKKKKPKKKKSNIQNNNVELYLQSKDNELNEQKQTPSESSRIKSILKNEQNNSNKTSKKENKKINSLSKKMSFVSFEESEDNNLNSKLEKNDKNKNSPSPLQPTNKYRFNSFKDPEVDEETRIKLKFGNGKNLVAIGPRKVRDSRWVLGAGLDIIPVPALDSSNLLQDFHSSPFSFGFESLNLKSK